MPGRAVTTLLILSYCAMAQGHGLHPLGRIEFDWRPDPRIVRTIALNSDSHAGEPIAGVGTIGRLEQRDGKACLVGSYFLFDIDDGFAFDIDETVTLDLTFDGDLTDGYVVSYDHAVAPRAVKARLQRHDGRRWHRERVVLERARFANRKYEGTDFSVGALGSLFLNPEGAGKVMALCGIRIERRQAPPTRPEYGSLSLNVVDRAGNQASVRVGLYDPGGVAPLAGDEAVTLSRYGERIKELPLLFPPARWSKHGRYVFFVDGRYRAELPVGRYTLYVMKGPEYRIQRRKVVIEANKTSDVFVKLERWIDMPARGWYSGDDHIHIERPSPGLNAMIHAYAAAEDIHVANLLEMGNLAQSSFRQYAFGPAGHYLRGGRALVSGQESPRTSYRGHTIGLNAAAFYWPETEYFLFDRTARAIHADGGLWGYAHVASDLFHVGRGLALDVPLGHVDFLEILQGGMMNTRYLYDFLNLGFRLLPGAGSDYPYIHLAGTERIYARIGGQFSVEAWFQAWRGARSFVSNWPVMDFTINGDSAGLEYAVASGDAVNIAATAQINPDFDSLDRLELIVHGDVVATATARDDSEMLTLEHTLRPQQSLWLALRAYGQHGGKAHTTPVFIHVDGDKRHWNPSAVKTIAERQRATLQALKALEPNVGDEWERSSAGPQVESKWRAAKPELDRQIAEAMAVYDRLIEEAERKRDISAQ